MADFASIPGGAAFPVTTPGTLSADAFYSITTGVVDRSLATGNTTVDGGLSISGLAAKTGSGNDQLIGGDANDTLNGGDGNDLISGGNGGNYLIGGGGSDAINAGSGNDTADGGTGDDQIFGGEGNNVITGGDGSDILGAGAGADSISGGAGNDSIWGGAGNDTLLGGSGDDTLGGGAGNDQLIGGTGNDLFVFAPGYGGDDTIVGFNAGDSLQITSFPGLDGALPTLGFALPGDPGFATATNKIEIVAGSVKVTIGSDTITIKGISGTTPDDLLSNLSWLKVATS